MHVQLDAINLGQETIANNKPELGSCSQELHDVLSGLPPRLLPSRAIDHLSDWSRGLPLQRPVLTHCPERVRAQLRELLERGYNRPSLSFWCTRFLFVPKKNGGMRCCIGYRACRIITVRNQPLIKYR